MVACAGAGRADDASLARFAPAEAGLFVELRGSQDLLVELTKPELWLGLADLAGQPADADDAERWRRRIERTVGMEPAQAIQTLFARGAAFVGEGPLRSRDAVVLCRTANPAHTLSLLNSWQARPREPRRGEGVFELRDNVAVGVGGDVMAFGDADPPNGMFYKVMDLARGRTQTSLQADPNFARLRRRAPADAAGLLFARLDAGRNPLLLATTQPTTQPAGPRALRPELPGPLRGATNLLIAVERSGPRLRFTAVGDGPATHKRPDGRLVEMVRRLPAKTLVAWGGHIDWDYTVRALRGLPPQHIGRLVFDLNGAVSDKQLIEMLDAPICAAAGMRPGTSATPPLPTLAVLATTRDADATQQAVTSVADAALSVYNLFAMRSGGRLLSPPTVTVCNGRTIRRIDLSPLMKRLVGSAGPELHLAWTIDGDVLIAASHEDWLAEILAARASDGRSLGEALSDGALPGAARSDTLAVLNTGPLADLGRLWLDQIERTRPHMLSEEYWRARQPGGETVQLGVEVALEREQRRLRVLAVAAGMPADGVLQPGDYIVGCNGAHFRSDQMVAEIRREIAQRPNARWVELLVQRGDALLAPRVPTPFVDPIRVLRQMVAVGELVQRVVYLDDFESTAGPRGVVTIELRRDQRPLFPIAAGESAAPPQPDPSAADRGQ